VDLAVGRPIGPLTLAGAIGRSREHSIDGSHAQARPQIGADGAKEPAIPSSAPMTSPAAVTNRGCSSRDTSILPDHASIARPRAPGVTSEAAGESSEGRRTQRRFGRCTPFGFRWRCEMHAVQATRRFTPRVSYRECVVDLVLRVAIEDEGDDLFVGRIAEASIHRVVDCCLTRSVKLPRLE